MNTSSWNLLSIQKLKTRTFYWFQQDTITLWRQESAISSLRNWSFGKCLTIPILQFYWLPLLLLPKDSCCGLIMSSAGAWIEGVSELWAPSDSLPRHYFWTVNEVESSWGIPKWATTKDWSKGVRNQAISSNWILAALTERILSETHFYKEECRKVQMLYR